jgi:hypothetical protein
VNVTSVILGHLEPLAQSEIRHGVTVQVDGMDLAIGELTAPGNGRGRLVVCVSCAPPGACVTEGWEP